MCAIAGIINFTENKSNPEELKASLETMRHRGPDDSGIKQIGKTILAHNRLSIIDLQGGRQPMSNEDGSIWISYNGEFYNFCEIRKELIDKGHHFKTNSDTETIIHLYEELGTRCVERINGMFAFAIVDANKNLVFLARDRLGKKPLIYFYNKDRFAFASEIRALSKLSDFPEELNLQAIHDFFSLQYIPSPHTVYKNVFKLPPAHTLLIDLNSNKISIQKYWSLDFSKKQNMSEEEAKEKLRELLSDAVKIRLIADVPLGLFLSGGIDSSIIASVMAELNANPIRTFTVGFTEKLYDERYAAREIAAKFATCHFEKMGDPAQLPLLEKLIANIGEPYADSSILPAAVISQFASSEVKTVLGGDGADELFCGYYRYMLMNFANFADALPESVRKLIFSTASTLIPKGAPERTLKGKLRRILAAFAETPQKRYYNIIVRFNEEMKKNIYGPIMQDCEFRSTADFIKDLSDKIPLDNPVEKHSALDIETYLNADILTKIDAASMASSIEARSPFLDYRIANFAASLPLKFKQNFRDRKIILKKTYADKIPKSIINREKKGFGVPMADWLRNKWKKNAEEMILEKPVKDGFLNEIYAKKLLNEHCSGEADHSYALFALLSFSLWLQNKPR